MFFFLMELFNDHIYITASFISSNPPTISPIGSLLGGTIAKEGTQNLRLRFCFSFKVIQYAKCQQNKN